MKGARYFAVFMVIAILAPVLFTPELVAQNAIQSAELEQFLAHAKITALKAIGTGVTLPHKATLELDGTVKYGVWKTIDDKAAVKQLDRGVELEFQDSWRTEVAAYELDKLIGLGMVPTTVERIFDGKHGSIQFWVDSKMSEAQRLEKKITPPNPERWNLEVQKTRLFDNLIYNTDRNLNNLLITEDFQIRLIDHSRTFRPFAHLKEPKGLTRFSKSLLESLRELNEPVLKEHLGKYITGYQIQGILKRRDAILALADKLVKEKGETAVIYP